LGFALVELAGGYLTQSLAITADAIHDFGDALSIGCAWGLEILSRRARDDSFHFGYRRFSLFAALLSGIVITAGSLGIAWKAAVRVYDLYQPSGAIIPPPVALGMIALAILGVLVNGGAAWNLRKGATQSEKVLSWHLLEDLFGWVIVLVGAIVLHFTGWTWIDPLLAIGLSLFVLWNVSRHLKDTIYLLLQGRPKDFSSQAFVEEVLAVPGIGSIDRIKAWSLDGVRTVISARIHLHSTENKSDIETLKGRVRHIAEHHFGATDITLETCLLSENCTE
ncbi:MAG: cation transporter, partial [Bdellovibrionales bacterium]|nr:cation transporter [Bdellovibrionales bacterium]